MWLLIASLLAVHALSAVAAPTTGTNFVFAFPCIGNSANLFVFIANPNNVDASISIYSSDPDFDPIEQSVDAQSTQQIQFYDPDMQLCSAQSQVAQRGVLVQSDQPISVYVDIETTDGRTACNFMVLPTSNLGRQYAMGDYTLQMIVALQDDTQITFSQGSTNVILNRLEAVTLQKSGNMTANKNVALIYSMNVYSSSSYSQDAFMALPVTFKASEFAVVPHQNVSSTYVRVFAFEDHTYVLLNGLTQNQINAGAYYDMQITQPSVIATSKKAQIATGYYYSSNQPAAQVVPSTYFLTLPRLIFNPMTHIQSNSKDPIHNLLIIVPQGSTAGQIAVDGVAIPALQYKRIASSSYYYTITPVSGDQHVITTNSAGIKYTASVFSTYSGQTYANTKFNIGFDLPAATE